MIDLIKGDCLEVMKDIPSGSIDAIITDPPYGTTACKWDSVIPFDLMWEQLNRVIKPNGAIVLFGSEPFSSALRMSNIKNYRYDWVWSKNTYTNFYFVKKQPAKKHEVISVFYNSQPTYNPQMEEGEPYIDKRRKKERKTALVKKSISKIDIENKGTRYPSSIQNFKNGGKKQHPTQKPILLIEYLIKTYTNEGESILDFTMGSGSTMVACQNTNRNGIGIEMDKNYFNIAKQRVKENEYKLL